MRAYLDGTLSVYQETFIPQDLWFSTEECNDNTIVSNDCICVSGLTCESKTEDKTLFCILDLSKDPGQPDIVGIPLHLDEIW